MSNDLTVQDPNVAIANTASEVAGLHAPVTGWARKKLEASQQEYQELDAAAALAKKNKWNTVALKNAARKALARVIFYEKVVAALEAGFMLFPPVPNADCIAVRTQYSSKESTVDEPERWGRHASQLEADENLVLGDGEYKSPNVKWQITHRYEKPRDDNTKEKRLHWSPLDYTDPEFPLLMGKPEIIKATSAAMELKVFDEIRMFPFERRRRGDPCILGTVYDARNDHRLYFLISWRVNESDL